SITQQQPTVTLKFISFGMAPKVVVVIDYKDTGLIARLLAVEMCGRKPADPAADNNKVVRFSGRVNGSILVPWFAVPQTVRVRETAVMVPTHSSQRGRVINLVGFWVVAQERSEQRLVRQRGADADCDPI